METQIQTKQRGRQKGKTNAEYARIRAERDAEQAKRLNAKAATAQPTQATQTIAEGVKTRGRKPGTKNKPKDVIVAGVIDTNEQIAAPIAKKRGRPVGWKKDQSQTVIAQAPVQTIEAPIAEVKRGRGRPRSIEPVQTVLPPVESLQIAATAPVEKKVRKTRTVKATPAIEPTIVAHETPIANTPKEKELTGKQELRSFLHEFEKNTKFFMGIQDKAKQRGMTLSKYIMELGKESSKRKQTA